MIYLKLYLILFALAFIVCALIIIIEDNYLKDVLWISLLNIFYLTAIVCYRVLLVLAVRKATRLLGRKPRNFKDSIRLGLNEHENIRSVKNLLKVLFMTKEEVK